MNKFGGDLTECKTGMRAKIAGAGEKAAAGAVAGALFGALLTCSCRREIRSS